MVRPVMRVSVERTDIQASKRAIYSGARLAGKKVAAHWWKKFLPYHFKVQATARYGYAKRTPGYQRMKYYRAGKRTWKYGTLAPDAMLPLILTGRLRDNVLHLVPKIRATRTKGTVALKAPRYLWYKDKGAQMRAEIMATTEGEMRELANVFAKAYRREAMKPLPRRRRRVA